MDSWSHGISVQGNDLSLVNEGSIVSDWSVIGFGKFEPGLSATIENTGVIATRYGGYAIAASSQVHLTNDGTMSGKFGSLHFVSDGEDIVTNNGILDGMAKLGGGNDIYHGESGSITGTVFGQAGDDLIAGGAGAENLSGGSGDDTITGGAGADRLTGATGADHLSGGVGDDVFRFVTARESQGDTIVASGGAAAFEGAGTAGGDRIDVSTVDADEHVAGSQHFVFGTSHDAGHLWAVDVGGVTHILGSVSGDSTPEFDLAINDGAGVAASDYSAADFIL
ncbi:MAG: hypothetical protein QM699_12580 [Amaricoccus sp.]|uniref:calcium-binding protein n=1 Tax=Amaricoccus sp. TaxID=1872485 RepID=UPI0039E33BA2